MLDWSPLSRFPCYADAVRHSRVAARCGAQLLTALSTAGSPLGGELAPLPPADTRLATCVGHSLGAHICGMLSRFLPHRLYKVVGKFVYMYMQGVQKIVQEILRVY